MAISGNLNINIGLPNESTGSDSLYTAFTKVNTNFDILFANASKVIAGNGITVTNNASNTVVSANLIAGTGIELQTANGAITIVNTGGSGNGGGNISGLIPGAGILLNGSNANVFAGNITVSLANSNVNPASYTNPTLTIDQFGRITSASNNTVSGTVTSVAISPGAGISVAGGPITSSGAITVTNTGVTRLTAGTGITLTGNTGNILVSAVATGVTSVGITSSTLTVTGSPVISSGNITVNLPNTVVQWTTAPVSNTSNGTAGQAAYDSGGNLYVCVSANTWAKFTGTTSW